MLFQSRERDLRQQEHHQEPDQQRKEPHEIELARHPDERVPHHHRARRATGADQAEEPFGASHREELRGDHPEAGCEQQRPQRRPQIEGDDADFPRSERPEDGESGANQYDDSHQDSLRRPMCE